ISDTLPPRQRQVYFSGVMWKAAGSPRLRSAEPPPERIHDGKEEYQDIRVLLRTMEPQELEKKLRRDGLRKQLGNLFNAK
ncbi:hypothetical protein PISMIDRAFT_686348, partial [Pisolithus microcarpus 441]